MLKLDNYFKIKKLVFAITFTAIVLLFTHIPRESIPPQLLESGLDKIYHFVAYGAITFLFILSLKSSPSLLSFLLVFFTILAVGIVDEVTQPLVNRQASYADLTADAVSIGTVLLLSAVFKCRFRNMKKQITNQDKP